MVQMLMVLLGLSLLWQDNICLYFLCPSPPPRNVNLMSEAFLSFCTLSLPGVLNNPSSLKIYIHTVDGIGDFCPEEECEHVTLLLLKEENEWLCHSSSDIPALVEASVVFVYE